MKLEEKMALVRRLYEELMCGSIPMSAFFAPDYVGHHGDQEIRGLETLALSITRMRVTHPHIRFRIDEITAQDDEVVVHYTVIGEPIAGTAIHRIIDNRIVEMWANSTRMAT